MNLKVRILEFIEKHPTGVRIIDMENPLNEKRMRLGFVTQTLIDEGKIIKVDDKYYPFTEKEELRFIRSSANN